MTNAPESARPCRVSVLEMARIRFPGGLTTSGAGQDYMRRLDKVFLGGAAFFSTRHDGSVLVMNGDESQQFNISKAEWPRVRTDVKGEKQ